MNEKKQISNEQDALEENIQKALKKINNIILVMSGKGGVGKSTMAVNIAIALSEKKMKVGLMDIDFHGPSTLKMLSLDDKKIVSDGENLIPIDYSPYLKVISMAALIENHDTAVVWRGPMKIGVIQQFLANVQWGDLDYLIIDSPPGTGDEPLTIAQVIKNAKSIIVTTPQEVSILDIRKSIDFCNKLNMPIVGIIENMSGFYCPHCNEKVDIFKTGGGKKIAEKMKINFLGAIPLNEKIMEASDAGSPYFSASNSGTINKEFNKIIEEIVQ